MKKIIIFTVVGLLIGMGLGSVVTMVYLGRKLAGSMFILQEVELIRSESDAIEAYLNEPPEIGIWALEDYIKDLNRVIKERKSEKKETLFIITLPKVSLQCAHIRLALLYEKIGNDLKRKKHFEKAFEYCDPNKTERQFFEESFTKAITVLDKSFKPIDEEMRVFEEVD